MRNAAFVVAQRAYAAGLRARYGRTGLPWRVHDEILRIDPRVRHLVPHDSEPGLFRFIQRHVVPGDVVLDVGSFLGIYAVLEARRAGPLGRVVAVEPTAWSASIARRHLEFNARRSASSTLVEAAVGEAPGQATFYEYEEPYVNALAAAVDVTGRATCRTVTVVTIDQLCDQLRLVPTFIRMDVQGAEVHALRGARNIIRNAGQRLRIVAEMHPQCWPRFGIGPSQVLETIDSLRLNAEPLEPGAELLARDGHVVLTPRGA